LSKKKDLKKLISTTLDALDEEIKAVLERPSQATLQHGERIKSPAEEYRFQFKETIQSLGYVDVIKVFKGKNKFEARPVEVEDEKLVLAFDDDPGELSESFDIEWDNDFVLRKTRERIGDLYEDKKNGLFPVLFGDKEEKSSETELEAYDDESRNKDQHAAITKALNQPLSYVWGPPGTGKTSTLGFIIANYLMHGKKVLFVSNTNRAVDVGMLSVLAALHKMGAEDEIDNITRFGEIALDGEELERIWFESKTESEKDKRRNRLAKDSDLMKKIKTFENELEELVDERKAIPQALTSQINIITEQIKNRGGREALEDRIEEGLSLNERVILHRHKLIGTTLAKVCTSDLMAGAKFDAVVIDEASMANLPYVMVCSQLAKEHMVFAGDPMQLPPISVTKDWEAAEFLERDIFTESSNSESIEDLFNWQDFYPQKVTFLRTQYRMKKDLADVISDLFYDGRLETAEELAEKSAGESPSIFVIDTARYSPEITKQEGSGFRPVNEQHQEIVVASVKRLLQDMTMSIQDIGLMVPFRSSVYDYRRLFYKEKIPAVEVGTVHTFQGREKRVIIFDTVMSAERTKFGKQRHYTVRPFDEDKSGLKVARLLNVACTRCQEKLIVIADSNHVSKVYNGKLLDRLIKLFSERSIG